MGKKFLLYESECPKCRILSRLCKLFDIRQKITLIPLRSKEAVDLLHEFYESIPYNFHFIDDEKDLCFTGLKAIPPILADMIFGLLWPYGSKGPIWLVNWKKKYPQSN
ncbi:MAG: hypothetical protein ACXAC7_15025 [Candidatus Hodarchaeales archaeon]|jgi:hypothetical protein